MKSKDERRKLGDDLRAELESEIDGFEIVYKEDDDWYKHAWYLRIVRLFFVFLDLFGADTERQFRENFASGIGRFLLLPNRDDYSDWSVPAVYAVVRHEQRHLLDWKHHPIWFPLSYLLVFPTVLTMRAHWELRGYTASMLGWFEMTGNVPEEKIEHYADFFASVTYFWMFPFRNRVEIALKETKRAISDGTLSGTGW